MEQQLKDSIVHTLATMVLDNPENPRFQEKCRTTIRDVLANMPSITIHRNLSRCLADATNCDDADGINALISAIRMA